MVALFHMLTELLFKAKFHLPENRHLIKTNKNNTKKNHTTTTDLTLNRPGRHYHD